MNSLLLNIYVGSSILPPINNHTTLTVKIFSPLPKNYSFRESIWIWNVPWKGMALTSTYGKSTKLSHPTWAP